MYRKPDFIIAGAMKSGTTWLHESLNAIPEVGIPRDEVHWIDASDPIVHPDFQRVDSHGLHLVKDYETSWHPEAARETESSPILGYDSTTLFHSRIDLDKVANQLPDTKCIVILRDPVERAFSHYWHLVRTGRARYGFERELLWGKQEILERSLYVDQARKMLLSFGDRVHFMCYERLFSEPDVVLPGVLEFLGLPPSNIEYLTSRTASKSNAGRYPRLLAGWLLGSRLLAGLERGRYARDVGKRRASIPGTLRYYGYLLKIVVMAGLACGVVRRTPAMRPATRESLRRYLKDANSGLDRLLAWDTAAWWYRDS